MVTYAVGMSPSGVAVGDFNQDGIMDVVASNAGSNSVSVLIGNGDGTFGNRADYAVGTDPVSVAVGDVDGDGVPDIATADNGSSTVTVLYNYGDADFAYSEADPIPSAPCALAATDFNKDGLADLVVVDNVVLPGTDIKKVLGVPSAAVSPKMVGTKYQLAWAKIVDPGKNYQVTVAQVADPIPKPAPVGEPQPGLPTPKKPVTAVAYSPKGNYLAAGQSSAGVRYQMEVVWNVTAGGAPLIATIPRTAYASLPITTSLSFSSDEQYLAAGVSTNANNAKIFLWSSGGATGTVNARATTSLATQRGASFGLAAFSPSTAVNKNRLAVAGKSGTGVNALQFWDVSTVGGSIQTSFVTFVNLGKPAVDLAFSRDGKTVATALDTGGGGYAVSAYDVSTLSSTKAPILRGRQVGFVQKITSLAISTDGNTIAVGFVGGSVSLLTWDTAGKVWKQTNPPKMQGLGGAVNALSFSGDGKILIAGTAAAGTNTGKLFVFESTGTAWKQLGKAFDK